MPVSGDLLKVLAEDPKALEHQLGCMTGLFQIFDRQGLGRRYGSKRVSNAASGQSQPTSACETPRLDRSSNPYWMFEDDSSQRISGDSFDRPKGTAPEGTREHHHRAYSDSSEIFTKSFETPTESRTSPDEKSQLDNSPMHSEESVEGHAFYCNDPIRESTLNSASSKNPNRDRVLECKRLTVATSTRANFEPKADGSDIRDVVRASFNWDQRAREDLASSRDKPRLSVDERHNQSHSHGFLKSLPRSSSVDGIDRLRLSVDGRLDTGGARQKQADLPRSTSVGGRGAARMITDWKDGLRNSGGSPRLNVKEKDLLKQQSSEQLPRIPISKHQNAGEGRDAIRLTVELKEGPRLSVSGDDRRTSVDGKVSVSPRLIGRSRGTCDLSLARPDFKDSLHATEAKELLRTPQKGGPKEGHRFSVDGTRDASRACIVPRLSVDGRDLANTGMLVPRKLKLDKLDRTELKESIEITQFYRQSSGRESSDAGKRPKASNVIARLMGLDELPSSKELPLGVKRAVERSCTNEADLLFQEFLKCHPLQGGSPPPPPSPPDDYDYAHRSSDHEDYHSRHWKENASCHPDFRQVEDPYSLRQAHFSTPKVQFSEPKIPNAAHQPIISPAKNESSVVRSAVVVKQSVEDSYISKSKSDELDPKEQCQVRKSPQGRRSLWHIFEAMQLKGVFYSSSRRKNAEALRVQSLKMTEEAEYHETRARSQSLPPRCSARMDLDHQDPPKVSLATANPRGVEQKDSEFHQGQKACALEADEVSPEVVKPIITRSASYKSQAQSLAAPTEPAMVVSSKVVEGAYNSNKEILPQNMRSGLSKDAYNQRVVFNEMSLKAPVQEPSLGQVPSNSIAILRQARKERCAARTSKSYSDLSQSGRDSSSPRGPRATISMQEKSARSGSLRLDSASSISPRCPPGSLEAANRSVDAGKVRRKAFVGKEVETKATLANFRANATKQEFLKGRASGDPDTPRPFRRSGSESKIPSKIAEKPIAVDIPAPKPSRDKVSSNVNLRSKRPVSKVYKSPTKTRPTNLDVNVKSVVAETTFAKDQPFQTSRANRPTSLSKSVPGSTQEQKPGVQIARERSLMSEIVRATPGGALDHSGDTTPSNEREHTTREKIIEIDEVVKTPRGVSIKKIDFSEDAQPDAAEQPSPVSVLDNSHFDEELTPSPKAGKSSVVTLPDQLSPQDDRLWNSARFLDLDLENTPLPALQNVPDANDLQSKLKTVSAVDTDSNVQDQHIPMPTNVFKNQNRFLACMRDADAERIYVEDLVKASELKGRCDTSGFFNSSTGYVLDLDIFDELETKRSRFESDERDILDRRVLFDCVNEVLEKLLETQLDCMQLTRLVKPRLRKRPTGMQLLKEVFAELLDIPCAASEDVCDTVYVILQKDLVRGRGQQWSDYNKELEDVGITVEKMIVKDLIEETVRDLSACCRQNPLSVVESSRRQLFA
ncbi:uncharacterized protein [Physcomitrium patens]|uniref:DUF4378 domain-containing protein n=1 Tax=Physcomitrium patens TaxID=3218 RepID=A0A7I4DW01_PHYPA|nr:uncharacterized protein LOC112282868 isoform X2 [Physcomitrium patens]|eukprot:XP_024376757.1 uncharacterized protein LOC112282868 isoform X2 [Physcomitrella patens]